KKSKRKWQQRTKKKKRNRRSAAASLLSRLQQRNELVKTGEPLPAPATISGSLTRISGRTPASEKPRRRSPCWKDNKRALGTTTCRRSILVWKD
ncbi:hypothetical protein V3C99_004709, partial [Haemonchus contortus]